MSILAIDQGTTSTRALVLQPCGRNEIICSIVHEQFYPQTGWVEHDPETLIQNIEKCIDQSISKFPDITTLGIDNQGESCLAWNAETKKAISPIIVWQDQRTQERIAQLKSDGVESTITALTGLLLDAYFSAAKLAWLYTHIPEAKRLHKIGKLCLGTTDAFFLHRLTGHFISDITTASRTSLMDLKTGQWSETLCDIFEVPIDTLPKIVPTTHDFGIVESTSKLIQISASVVDQQASLYGHGCRDKGQAKITFGTGAFALMLTGESAYHAPEQGLLPTVAWQLNHQSPTYALDGGVYCAGSAINWAKSLGLFTHFNQINTFKNHSAIEKNLIFVPALTGLACPHWDRQAAGMWIGLALDTTAMDMMQSVLEGIALRAAEVMSAMGSFTSIGDRISIDGGVASNPYFCQFLSTILEKEIVVQQSAELTALGTALLASHGDSNQSIPAQDNQTILYSPAQNLSNYLDKFSEAICRSKQWH